MISVAADVSEASGEGTERSVRTKAKKAAEDSRTPRRCRDGLRATPSARSWSAAVLCRFDLSSLASGVRESVIESGIIILSQWISGGVICFPQATSRDRAEVH